MKKLIALMTAGIMLAIPTAALADETDDIQAPESESAAVEYVDVDTDNVTVIVNGAVLETSVPAHLVGDSTVVPMRAIFEKLGANVEWIGESQLIISTKGAKIVTMKIGSDTMHMKDNPSQDVESVDIALPVAPYLENDETTMVPLRAVSEAFDATVTWDEATYTVTITL